MTNYTKRNSIEICEDMECVIFNEVGQDIVDSVKQLTDYSKKDLVHGKTGCVLDMTRRQFDLFIGNPDPHKIKMECP